MSIFPGGPRRPASSAARIATLLGMGVLFVAAGCNEQQTEMKLDTIVQDVFAPRKTPQQYMVIAVSSEDPDLRRDAVARISRSKLNDKEWAIKGFYAIACLETDTQTRCVAVRALARTCDPRASEAALKILNHADYPAEEVVPPTPLVRWDATQALADLAARGCIPDESRDEVRGTLIDRLRSDSERHTRIAAARGLAHFPSSESLTALIGGLRDDEFTVVHECENSLVALTGVTHNLDATAWEDWLAEHADDAFADAGNVPESRRPPYDGAVGKMTYDTVDLFEYLWPGPAK